jgi:Tfp pilus assembly protein PilZ
MEQRKERRFKQWNRTMILEASSCGKSPGPVLAEAFTYDLSLGGARIHSLERFEVGTALRLHIELVRTKEMVCVEGRVKWLKTGDDDKVFEMGVEFDHANMQTVLGLMRNLHDGRLMGAETI